MAARRQIVDTNVLVRFFCGEPSDHAAKARRLIEKADEGSHELIVYPIVVAEVFYTLHSYYKIDGATVAQKLAQFLNSRGIKPVEKDALLSALSRCESQGAHFADAYLAAIALDSGLAVASFDKDFDKFKGVRRAEPS